MARADACATPGRGAGSARCPAAFRRIVCVVTVDRPALAWQLTLLGGFMLERGAQRLPRLPSRSAVALLARLALRPHRDHAREELAAWLWPEANTATGLARLRQTLSTLKGLLERSGGPGVPVAVIQADRQVLRLAAGALRCDAVAFEAAVRRRDRAAAARLYRGELLPGHYDEWIAAERLRLQSLADGMALDAGVADGDPPVPAPMAAALRTAARPPADDGLPHYLTARVGGPGPEVALAAQVAVHRLVSVRGTGGLGKTRLAVAAARWLVSESRFDTARFVPWAGCTTWPEAALRLAQALGQSAGATGRLLDGVVRALAGRNSLLVLDNCEQCRDEVLMRLPDLLARLPGLHLLMTTRRTLGMAGEVEWQPEPLACPSEGAAFDTVAGAPAVQLFVERARARRADFLLNDGNADAVARITRLLGGLPLAIELAAAPVRTVPPGRMAALLAAGGPERWRLLGGRLPGGPAEPRHASMAAVVEASLAGLTVAARRLLDRLAVVPAPVCGAWVEADGDPAAARQALAELAGSSLLAPSGDDGHDSWWVVPEPVRDLLLEAMPSTVRDEAMASWRRAVRVWAPGLAPEWRLDRVERALLLLTAVLHPDATPPAPDVLDLLLALGPAWAERRPPEAVRLALEQALDQLAQVPAGAELLQSLRPARALAAELAFAAGRRDDARRHAAWLATEPPTPSPDRLAAHPPNPDPTTAQVHLTLARVAWRVDADHAAARAALQRAAAADDRPVARALQLRFAATLAFEADRDTATSEQLLQQALRLLPGDASVSRHLTRALRYNLAIAAVHDGRPAEALPLLDALVDEAAAVGNARLRSDALNSRGSAHQSLGHRDAAEADTRSALAEAWSRLETESALYALWNLGLMASERGDAERAARLMAFADRFWRLHFGSLTGRDARDVAGLRRRCRQRLGRLHGQRCWDEGAALPLAAAVALALGSG